MALALAPHEIQKLFSVRSGFADCNDLDESLQGRLFEHFCDNGEMPYGTAKARDGDPMEWISKRLAAMTSDEFNVLIG
jgi:hypothetical protein